VHTFCVLDINNPSRASKNVRTESEKHQNILLTYSVMLKSGGDDVTLFIPVLIKNPVLRVFPAKAGIQHAKKITEGR